MICMYIKILTVGVLFFQSHGVLHSQDSSPSMLIPGCGRQPQEWSLQVCSLQRFTELAMKP